MKLGKFPGLGPGSDKVTVAPDPPRQRHSHNEVPTRRNPPTTEDIHRAIKDGTWRGTTNVKGALGVLFQMTHVEQFNFGPLTLNTIREAQDEACDFVEEGLLHLPYPECIFRCSVFFDNREVGFHMYAIERNITGGGKLSVLTTVHSDSRVYTFRCDNPMKIKHVGDGKRGIEFSIPNSEMEYWGAHDLPENNEVIVEGGLILLGLLMILNTKGVLKERTAPPAKPNKVRAARGIPLLPYTTKVYTSVYNEAVKAGPQGTHSSPRPHRRRAHIRRIPKTDKHDAYVIPIDAMLVNWDGQPLVERAEYVRK